MSQTWIDVSSWQGAINWANVARAGVQGAFIKCSEGTGEDPDFAANWNGTAGNGMLRGAYHFADPSTNPTQCATAFVTFINNAGGLRAGDVLVVDMEFSPVNATWANGFLTQVRSLVGAAYVLLVYASQSYVGSELQPPPNLAALAGLWMADWTDSTSPVPAAPYPWTSLAAWQWTDHASVAGMSVDEDVVFVGFDPPAQPTTGDNDVNKFTWNGLQALAYVDASGVLTYRYYGNGAWGMQQLSTGCIPLSRVDVTFVDTSGRSWKDSGAALNAAVKLGQIDVCAYRSDGTGVEHAWQGAGGSTWSTEHL